MRNRFDIANTLAALASSGASPRYTLGIEPAGNGAYRMAALHIERGKAVEIIESAIVDEANHAAELERLGFRRGAYAALAIPRHEVVWESARVPTRDPSQLARVVANDAKALSHWPEDATATGYILRDDEEDGYSHVDYMFVHAPVIHEHVGQLRAWGIALARIEVSTLGLARLLADEKSVARLARVTPECCEVLECESGKIRASMGANSGAEELVQDALDWMDNADPDHLPAPIWILVNEGPIDLSALPALQTARGLNSLNPGLLNGASPIIPPSEVCVGAALSGLLPDPPSNLLPPAESRASALRDALRQAIVFVIAVVLLSTLTWGIAAHYLRQERNAVTEIRQELRTLRADAGDLESKWEQLGMMQGELTAVQTPLHIVLDLYERTPVSIAINHMRLDLDRGVVLSGEAPSHAAVLEYIANLRQSNRLSHVDLESSSQPSHGQQSIVDFKIACGLAGEPRQ